MKYKNKTAYTNIGGLSILISLFLFPLTSLAQTELNVIVELKQTCNYDKSLEGVQEISKEQLTPSLLEMNISSDNYNTLFKDSCVESVEPNKKVSLASLPNDPQFSNQWYLHNTGQSVQGRPSGTANIDIGFSDGYESIKNINRNTTVVAVVDTGVTTISELSGNVLTGYNSIADNSNTVDDNGHGTFISSIISAKTDNSADIAGIDSAAKIMPIKVLDSSGSGYVSDVIKGIQYAINHNAHIINLSLVSNYSSSFDSILEQAYNKGIIVIAAGGNSSSDLGQIKKSPVSNDGPNNWVVGVSSFDQWGNKSSFSNFGSGIDTSAPGDDIIGLTNSGTIDYESGTSVASGITAGIIAAWRDYYGTLTPKEVQNMLLMYNQNGRIKMDSPLIRRQYTNGTLLKSPSSGVFLFKNNIKYPFISPEIFLSYDYEWKEIVTISEVEFNAIPSGEPLKMRDGSLIADKGSVYVVEFGYKRPIASAAVFLGRGYNWNNVTYPGKSMVDFHPTGALVDNTVGILNGTVAYTDGKGVSLIEYGKRRPIVDPAIYTSYFNWKYLVKVSSAQLDAIPEGDMVYPQEGILIADKGSVYIVQGTQKLPFGSASAFLKRGYRWDAISFPPPYMLNILTKGSIIN